MDHKVTGAWPATMSSGGGRRCTVTAGHKREKEGEGVQPGQELTPEAMARTARHR